MTANLLKSQLITYTQRICHKYNISMTKKRLQNSAFDYQFMCWNSNEFLLPTNPYKSNSPILLVPKDFLNLLPEINADDFEYTIQLSERLRNDFNYEVDKNLDKHSISKIAIEHYDLVQEYINIVEKRKATTFSELMKKTLRYTWYELSKGIVENNKFSFSNIANEKEFFDKILEFADYYKEFIELRSGYKLLWNETKTLPRSEEDVQLLFKGILDDHCRANNIDFTREVNQAMGPVDFRFSSGYSNRVLLEAKLAKNTKFWNGLKKQLPKYLKIDKCKYGIFLVIVFSDKDIERINSLQDIANETSKFYNVTIKTVIVDARIENKLSASKL